MRRALLVPSSFGAVLVTVLALGGCTGDDPATSGPSPARSAGTTAPAGAPTSTGPASADRTLGTITTGDVVLDVSSTDGSGPTPALGVVDGPEGAVTATLTAATTLTLRLAGPAGGSLARSVDGSVSVLDDAGATVGGLQVSAPGGTTVGVPDATTLDVVAGDAPDTVTVVVGSRALDSATWGVAEGGRSLAVDATEWARHGGQAGVDAVWSAVVAAEPDADSPGMRDQLDCHALGAPDKATWNLEPWRPDVGLIATAAASCNPS